MTHKLIATVRAWGSLQAPSLAEMQQRSRQFRALGLCLIRALARLPIQPLPAVMQAVADRRTVKGKPYWEWRVEDVCDMAEAALGLDMPAGQA